MVDKDIRLNRLLKAYIFSISLFLEAQRNKMVRKILICLGLVELIIWDARYKIFYTGTTELAKMARSCNFLIVYLLIYVGLILLFSTYLLNQKYERGFLNNGFKNSKGFAPILKDYYVKNGENFYVFFSKGIDVEKWKNNIFEIENAMDITIDDINLGKNNYEIVISAVKGKGNYKKEHLASDESDDGIVILGNGLVKKKIIDLNVSAHMLIAGSTGSGKTWLFKSVLVQLVKQNAKVYLADFKGGVDYPKRKWNDKCYFMNDIKSVEESLILISKELTRRKELLSGDDDSSNIKEYNLNNKHHRLNRIVLACDELAQLTDLKGLNKEEKAQRERIIKHLTEIAQLGRAFGIHLILSTQRPDADVVPGQIKNNIDTRICGRADTTLSTIILGSGIANEKIPKNEQGLFIDNQGDVFRGFMINS